MYSNCLNEEVKPLLASTEPAIDIADSVAHKCETILTQYRKDVSNYLFASTNEGSRTQYEVLMIEPDRRVESLRDKGKRATISRVVDYRESLKPSK